MFIKRLSPNVYDVFVGNGWNNWTRVRRERGDVTVIGGAAPSKHLLGKVKERICR